MIAMYCRPAGAQDVTNVIMCESIIRLKHERDRARDLRQRAGSAAEVVPIFVNATTATRDITAYVAGRGNHYLCSPVAVSGAPKIIRVVKVVRRADQN